ncbi:MAG: hypothetical protein QHC90_04270 [Shinella sp.]|nr:hypothetical protein [Shinella sp.]
MVWIFAVAALTVLYLAIRFRRFRNWVEPVLTIAVALGLIAAIIVWLTDDNRQSGGGGAPSAGPATAPPAIAPEVVELGELAFVQGQPANSYRVSGIITNGAEIGLQSFDLTVRLEDCPEGTCRFIGEDTALIIARVPPMESLPFSTFLVFPEDDLRPVTAPQWSWTVRNPRPYGR